MTPEQYSMRVWATAGVPSLEKCQVASQRFAQVDQLNWGPKILHGKRVSDDFHQQAYEDMADGEHIKMIRKKARQYNLLPPFSARFEQLRMEVERMERGQEPFLWVTINPPPGYDEVAFRTKLGEFLRKDKITWCVYTYEYNHNPALQPEQRDASGRLKKDKTKTEATHQHVHMALRHTWGAPSKVCKAIADFFAIGQPCVDYMQMGLHMFKKKCVYMLKEKHPLLREADDKSREERGLPAPLYLHRIKPERVEEYYKLERGV
jgi:hypothetical protein